MGDLSNEPSMEDILSSIKRIIAEEGDGASPRGRRIGRPASADPEPETVADEVAAEVLELDQPVAAREAEARTPAPERAEPRPASFAAARTDAEMLSPRVAEATRGQLEALSRLIVKPDIAGGDTLEGLVREMLKPMLSQWLDANLPRIVEAMVSREIARISGRRDD